MKSFFTGIALLPLLLSAQLNNFVTEWSKDPDLKGALTSFCVYDMRSGMLIAEHNAHSFMIPASTLKTITTAAALRQLGNNFKFKTHLAYTGTFNKQSGVLDGDLIIIGGGDPTLESELFPKNDSGGVTEKWAKIIKEQGIREIKGKIIGDASAWEHSVPGNWIWADIGNYFGAVPCALSFMDNKFKLLFNTNESGTAAVLSGIKPQVLNGKIIVTNKVIAKGKEDEAYVYGDPLGYEKNVSGQIPPGKTNYEVEAASPDPAWICAEYLLKSLTKAGISCKTNSAFSSYEKKDSTFKPTFFYTHYSPSLEKIVQVTNITSNNLFAETLLKTLGNGSSYTGIEIVKKYLNSQKLDAGEIFMTDGSGLSRANLVTTALQAELLLKVYQDNFIKNALYNSLPVAGKQGSMSNIGKGKYIENNMRAKTGYINKARGYCGYVKTKSGKELAFSILFNNYRCSAKDAKLKIEKFLIELGEL